jgi:hypothetical protein
MLTCWSETKVLSTKVLSTTILSAKELWTKVLSTEVWSSKVIQSFLYTLLLLMSNLNVLSLNCCGVKLRLQYPEFCELIKKNDIVCLQETKTDDIDKIDLVWSSINLILPLHIFDLLFWLSLK